MPFPYECKRLCPAVPGPCRRGTSGLLWIRPSAGCFYIQTTHLFPETRDEIVPPWMENVFPPTCFQTWLWVLLAFKEADCHF